MATHSTILAWRIPGTEEPVGLPSMGLYRVGHDWRDLAAAAAALLLGSHPQFLEGRFRQSHGAFIFFCIENNLGIIHSANRFWMVLYQVLCLYGGCKTHKTVLTVPVSHPRKGGTSNDKIGHLNSHKWSRYWHSEDGKGGVIREGARVLRSKYCVCKMVPRGRLSQREASAALTCLSRSQLGSVFHLRVVLCDHHWQHGLHLPNPADKHQLQCDREGGAAGPATEDGAPAALRAHRGHRPVQSGLPAELAPVLHPGRAPLPPPCRGHCLSAFCTAPGVEGGSSLCSLASDTSVHAGCSCLSLVS